LTEAGHRLQLRLRRGHSGSYTACVLEPIPSMKVRVIADQGIVDS
jgi:hypothetical protein